MTTLRKALILATFFAMIAVIAGVLHSLPWPDTEWHAMLPGFGSLACFGVLLGGIHAFDPASELMIKPSVIGRVSFGVLAALLLSALWRWTLPIAALAASIGAVLGYLGMRWAEYVNF